MNESCLAGPDRALSISLCMASRVALRNIYLNLVALKKKKKMERGREGVRLI